MLKKINNAGLSLRELSSILNITECELKKRIAAYEDFKQFLDQLAAITGRCPCYFIGVQNCEHKEALQGRVMYLQNLLLSVMQTNYNPDITNHLN